MKHSDIISDELLTRYLSGNATPEEEAAVLDHAAASDENAEDLLHIAAAVRTQQRAEQPPRRTSRPLYWAAAVLMPLLVAGAGFLFFDSNPGSDGGFAAPITAEATTYDSTKTTPAQSEALSRHQVQQPHACRLERQQRLTAAQGVIHYADSTPADTYSHCLKSITL